MVLYVFGGWIHVDYVTPFVASVLLLAFDFWTVKNVTGRLLVGLRWWVHVSPEDGSNQWVFESNAGVQVPTLDYRIFWWALYGAPLTWCVAAGGRECSEGGARGSGRGGGGSGGQAGCSESAAVGDAVERRTPPAPACCRLCAAR